MSSMWPYSMTRQQWACAFCGAAVLPAFTTEEGYYPASLYWNCERGEVYCGAEHSLAAHESHRANVVAL